MFEEICLQCGKPIDVDGRAYCSGDCEGLDASTSPSISSASSAFPSPHLSHTMTGPVSDIPALMPSALGRALASRATRDQYSLSSISASNWAGAIVTDEDDYDYDNAPVFGVEDDYTYIPDVPLDPSDGTTTNHSVSSSASIHPLLKAGSFGLSYTRRPSTTNNRSILPRLHRRVSSESTSSATPANLAKSAPSVGLYLSDDDSLSLSDVPSYLPPPKRDQTQRPREAKTPEHEGTAKPKQRRNRASLPAYFALLQGSSPSPAEKASFGSSHPKVSYSSTLRALEALRLTPSTPTTSRRAVDNSDLEETMTFASSVITAVPTTPRRGRRRERLNEEDDTERSSSRRSPSSRSPSRSSRPRDYGREVEGDEHMMGYSQRGRVAVRRNSNPHPLSQMSFVGRTDRERTESEGRRGRLKPEELEEFAYRPTVAPGYGSGRSGLRDRRERVR